MLPLDGPWKTTLPTLEAIDAHIAGLEAELSRVRSFREGVRLILSATGEVGRHNGPDSISSVPTEKELQGLSAKDRIIKVLADAGRPVKWTELQALVSRGPNPPNPGTIASAYYHNTKAGSRSFVPLPGGYAGLAGRDEGWEPEEEETSSSEEDGKPTLRDLLRRYLETHAEFTLHELTEALLAERPDALKHTIRGHLSYAKTKGEVENIERGRWKSNLFAEPEEVEAKQLPLTAHSFDEE